MRERPILFSGPMVRALLAGTKTQTRRAIKTDASVVRWFDAETAATARLAAGFYAFDGGCWHPLPCPYGAPGDRLWVRETHGYVTGAGRRLVYRADGDPIDRFSGAKIDGMKWAPSIFMPRGACRLRLEITDVRVQRVQEISEENAEAEGTQMSEIVRERKVWHASFRAAYAALWDTVRSGERLKRGEGWAANPWVWALTFRRIE